MTLYTTVNKLHCNAGKILFLFVLIVMSSKPCLSGTLKLILFPLIFNFQDQKVKLISAQRDRLDNQKIDKLHQLGVKRDRQ